MARPGKRFTAVTDILLLRRAAWPVRGGVFIMMGLLVLPYLIVPFYAFGRPVSTVMAWRVLTGAPMQRIYVPLARIAPALSLAVIVAEDGRFCTHHGVDFAEIRDAIADADDLGDLRGGSTITQQVAKNLFLWRRPQLAAQGARIPAGAMDRPGAVEAAHSGNLPQYRRMGPDRRIRRRGRQPLCVW